MQCRETLLPSAKSSEPAVRLAPYIWTHQYTFLSPKTCWVVDDGTGRAVGYCIGCPDTPSFCAAYDSYVARVLRGIGVEKGDICLIPTPEELEHRAQWIDPDTGRIGELCLSQLAFSPRWLLEEGNEDLLEDGYRATMHIDLLDEFQGQGWGRKLLETLVQSLKEQRFGGKGLWLGIGGENVKVVPFYEKLGFRVRERDVKTPTITMVRDY